MAYQKSIMALDQTLRAFSDSEISRKVLSAYKALDRRVYEMKRYKKSQKEIDDVIKSTREKIYSEIENFYTAKTNKLNEQVKQAKLSWAEYDKTENNMQYLEKLKIKYAVMPKEKLKKIFDDYMSDKSDIFTPVELEIIAARIGSVFNEGTSQKLVNKMIDNRYDEVWMRLIPLQDQATLQGLSERTPGSILAERKGEVVPVDVQNVEVDGVYASKEMGAE